MTALLILGAGGHAKVLAETALAQGSFSRIAFWMIGSQQAGESTVLGWPVLGPLNRVSDPAMLQSFNAALVGLGDAAKRLFGWISLAPSAMSAHGSSTRLPLEFLLPASAGIRWYSLRPPCRPQASSAELVSS